MLHERQPSILLVEDNPDEEMLVMRAVRRSSLSCQILVAHSTEEAIDYLFARGAFEGRGSRSPDVIVTDLKIGSTGGAEFVSSIRAHRDIRLIPIVVLSGSATGAQIEDLYRRGANSFLEKPTDFEEFSTAIIRLVKYWGTVNTSVSFRKKIDSFPYPL